MSSNKGWAYVISGRSASRKAHYFPGNIRALCGGWLKFSLEGLRDTHHPSPDNCQKCLKIALEEGHIKE